MDCMMFYLFIDLV